MERAKEKISCEEQFLDDLQFVYEQLKKLYEEDDIIILGYSIGTGPAAILASANQPRLLILQAPYFALTDIMEDNYPFVPTFILKYRFETGEAVQKCKTPVVIFHGNKDEVTPYSSALRFEKVFKSTDRLITLHDQGHNGMTRNPEYLVEIQKILNSKSLVSE